MDLKQYSIVLVNLDPTVGSENKEPLGKPARYEQEILLKIRSIPIAIGTGNLPSRSGGLNPQ
jgi:hypothetical protein